jgi:aryl-alcohol dehydrogenase-like predicted oxidoreductase
MDVITQAGQVHVGDKIVYRLGLGTNRITNTEQARSLLKKAVSLGINFIDTANVYRDGESEETIGHTLAPFSSNLLVATKGGMNGGKPEQLRLDLEGSLRRLKTKYVDLYQLHRVDPSVPLERSMRALKEFQDEGKIKYIGLSEVSIKQIQEANTIVPIVSVQNEYNLVKRQYEDVVDYCTDQKIIFIPWFPLGGLHGDVELVNKRISRLAAQYSATAQQISLAWLLARSPLMLPIPGTLSIEHLISNINSASIHLSEEDYAQLTNL